MEFNFKDLLFIIARRAVALVLALVIGAFAAFLYASFIATPRYDCEVTLVVNADPSTTATTGTIAASENLVKAYIATMKDYSFAQMIKRELPASCDGYSVSDIRDSMTLSSVDNSQILSVKITTTSSNDSYQIAKIIEENAPFTLRSYFDNAGSIVVLRRAEIQKNPSAPNIQLTTVLGAILGFAIIFIIVVALEMLDKRIKTEEDIEKYVKYPILGTINKLED